MWVASKWLAATKLRIVIVLIVILKNAYSHVICIRVYI